MADIETEIDGVKYGARIEGPYRYWLWRYWTWPRGPRNVLAWIMLNPSTADHKEDDPTIRRCVAFARNWEYDGIEVVNLFSLVSPHPADLLKPTDPIGPASTAIMRLVIEGCPTVIAAWGSPSNGRIRRLASSRADDLWKGVLAHHPNVLCLGTTKDGEPRHPLYMRRDTPRQPYRRRA